MKIHIENIGCFKNLVDSERLMYAMKKGGMEVSYGKLPGKVDIAIINTCGFVGMADDDSANLIKEYSKKKMEGIITELWVIGCYGQKYGQQLKTSYPIIDRVFGNFEWNDILYALGCNYEYSFQRHIVTPKHYAYLKISEGCNRPCSFCIKPMLNGKLSSIPMEKLIEEVKWLVSKGVHEFQLVAQNLTDYGLDIYRRKAIAELVSRIADVEGVDWIRLHYAYPTDFSLDLLDVIRERENVCNYIDIALQHCNTKILNLMRRGGTKESIETLLYEIRSRVPGIYIRTTMMVGFPGETKSEFDELCEFVEKQKFERMGVFRYSAQVHSYSYSHYIDTVSESDKTQRALYLMNIQKQHYMHLNESLVGTVHRAIVDSCINGKYYCRTEHSTPMADPKIIVESSDNKQIGSFYKVKVIKAIGKDVIGRFV